jgi:TetR/AcrR family transcriptional repressor of mexCD-oprJ operon
MPTGPGTGMSRSRRMILDAAVRVLVVDRGASMQKIATAAGVGRTTIHRYFPGREDLIRAIAMDAVAESEVAMEAARLEEGSVAGAVGRLAEALVPMGHRFQFLLGEAQLGHDPEFLAAEERTAAPIEDLVERGQRDGTFRVGIPRAWIVDAIAALVYAAWEGVHAGRIAALDAPGLVTSTLLSGLGSGDDVRE